MKQSNVKMANKYDKALDIIARHISYANVGTKRYDDETISNSLSELSELVNLSIPKKVKCTNHAYPDLVDNYYYCPNCCRNFVKAYQIKHIVIYPNYCSDCGQKLDWSEE